MSTFSTLFRFVFLHLFILNIIAFSSTKESFISMMLPVEKGEHIFNRQGEEEWEIQRDTNVLFAIYGKNLHGAQLSFTTHRNSCQYERKDRIYPLQIETSTSPPRAFVQLNLPFYNSTLFLCLTPKNSTQVIHQGNRATLKVRLARRALPIWTIVICLIFLLSLSGLFSGLNLGLMSLTPHDLVVIQEAGSENDRKYARRIYPVRKKGNFLLCTILLGNVLVNSTATILLDMLVSGGFAVAGATLAIVIFGEIIPQAICSRHGLEIGSRTIFLTRLFMYATFPIAYPLSKLLDIILGEEVGARYTRDQMSALLKHTKTTDIEDREKNIMTGVLSLKGKKIRDVMTNLVDVFMLEADRIVDDELVLNVYGYGYSRIPVYEKQRENIIGLVNARDFALPDTDSGKFTVRNIMNFCKHRYGTSITPDDSSYDVFNVFKKEQYHFGVVVEFDNSSEKDPKAKAVGIVTLEDIIEEMIQEEIVDETDVFTDNRRKVRNILVRAPDFSVFMRQNTNESSSKISAQMKVAILQFLSTTVEPFKEKYISSHILSHLLNIDLYKEYEFNEDETKAGRITYIYEYGKPVDYFVLIVNGNAELETGKEKIISEISSFYYFGTSALYSPEEKLDDLLRSKSNKFRPFVPDFSLRVSENIQILRIRRIHWLAAVRASYFEKKSSNNGETPTTNSDENQIVCLIEELEKADQIESNNNTSTTVRRKRTSSSALMIASDSALEQDKLLDENSRSNHLTNTPMINAKYRHHFLRSRNSATPPPTGTSISPSMSKNRSLTVSTP